MTVMTWDVKETNTGRPLNDFTWFSIKNYMIYNTVSFVILGLSYSEIPCNNNAVPMLSLRKKKYLTTSYSNGFYPQHMANEKEIFVFGSISPRFTVQE